MQSVIPLRQKNVQILEKPAVTRSQLVQNLWGKVREKKEMLNNKQTLIEKTPGVGNNTVKNAI